MLKFKIRCSAISEIMAEPKAVAQPKPYTATELKKAEKEGVVLPEIEPIILTPEQFLSAGAKTYVQNWAIEQLYKKSKAFGVSSKYTKKGTMMESDAISYLEQQNVIGWAMKNTERFSNEFITGEPDLIFRGQSLVVDVKCSYSCFTFPTFEKTLDSQYEWQVQGYMGLLGLNSARVIYCLTDAPESVIEQEAYRYARSQDSELTEEIYEQVKENMTYSHLPASLRIKYYSVAFDAAKFERIEQKVRDCRAYLKVLL